MAITLRSNKGLPLTHIEMDGNFSDLDSRLITLESAGDSDNQTLTLSGTTLSISNGNSVNIATAPIFDQTVNIADSVTFANVSAPITTSVITGSPELELNPANRVTINSALLRLANLTELQRNLLVPLNGDMIFNTTSGTIQTYLENITAWVDLNDTDTYVSSAVFDDATGDLVLTKSDTSTVTVNLDGRYVTSETDSQTLSLVGSDLSISNGNTVDLSSILVAEADTLDSVTSRNSITTNTVTLGGAKFEDSQVRFPGTETFETTITQDTTYLSFRHVDNMFDPSDNPITDSYTIRLGNNRLQFENDSIGRVAYVQNTTISGDLYISSGNGEPIDGRRDGGDINIFAGAAASGGDGGRVILNGNSGDILIGPLANTANIRIGGGPGYAGGNTTYFHGNVNFETGRTVDFTGATVDFNGATIDWSPIVSGVIQNNGLPVSTKFTQPVPTTSKGASGDTQGAVTFDSSYIYYCTATYTDGVADIWKRVAWSGDTW